jgi:hypothetical protein
LGILHFAAADTVRAATTAGYARRACRARGCSRRALSGDGSGFGATRAQGEPKRLGISIGLKLPRLKLFTIVHATSDLDSVVAR